jgi:putative ABC transport system permease protein
MPGAQSRFVTAGYFRNLGIPILKGREFTPEDNSHGRGVAIIDEALSRKYWPDENPVGWHIMLNDNSYDAEIVGVAGSVKHFTLDEEPMQTLYTPLYQVAAGNVGFLADNCNLAIHTDGNPMSLQTAVRGAIRSVDSDVPVSNSRTMEQFLAASTAPRRFNLLLLAVFAGVGLLLAATGIYAVMSFSVTQRSQEIGIRMALGARPFDVTRLILGHGMKLVLIGIVFGLGAGFIATRFISSLLFGINTIDPLTFVVTPLVLLVVSIVACYFPARKARKVDPIVTLRAG